MKDPKVTLRVGSRDPEMEFIYISGLMRGKNEVEVARNTFFAWRFATELWAKGHAPLCPHKNGEYMQGLVSVKQFMKGDLLMVERCDSIIMLPGWRRSKGAVLEHAHAKALGKKVYYSLDAVPALVIKN